MLCKAFKNKSFKVFIVSLTLITYLSVSISFSYRTAKADVLALSALGSGISLSGAGGAITSALSVAALPALVIVGGAVTAGVIYKNRYQIRDFALGAMDYLTSVGQGIGKGVVDMGNGVVKMTGTAKTALLDYVGQVKRGSLPALEVPLVNSISVPAGTTVSTNIVIPFSTDLNVQMNTLKTGSSSIWNTRFKYRIEGYPNVSMSGDGRVTYDTEYGRLWCGGDYVKLPTYGNICVDIENHGSFPTEVGVIQNIPRDNSICANVSSTPLFQDEYFSKPIDTYIAPSNTATWDKVVDFSGAIPSDIVKVSDVPISIPGTDTGTDVGNPNLDLSLPDIVKLDFSPLEINFKDKFPFCIPFDLYNSISALNVSPKPPKFDINFDKRYFKGGGNISIDFSQFESWASIIRWGILISFSIALIIITRRLIGG